MAVYPLVFLVGLAVGSFLNVVITRLPQEEGFWWGRSRCPQCRHPLPWYDNLPLVSYLRLRGVCRFCGSTISWRYPAVELVAGLLALALWLRFPGSPLLWVYGPFGAALLVLSVIDLEHRLLPDLITLPGIVLGLALVLIFPHLTFAEAALGAVVGGGIFFLIAWGYQKVTGNRGMGGGDVKLMAFIGAFLGIKSLPLVIFMSAALGSVVGLGLALIRGRWQGGQWRAAAIPYGPFLSVAAMVYLLASHKLLGFPG